MGKGLVIIIEVLAVRLVICRGIKHVGYCIGSYEGLERETHHLLRGAVGGQGPVLAGQAMVRSRQVSE
jgi:hypothetical protein